MSYDLQVWSVDRPRLPAQLPSNLDWVVADQLCTYAGNKWQVSVSSADTVLPEDIPADVQPLLAGIQFLTELNLSPFDASPTGRRWLSRTAKQLAKFSHGVVVDPQKETAALPAGVKRFSTLSQAENASLLMMNWCFVDGPLMQRNVAELIEVLSGSMNEALPRRYGLWEPPQHQLAVEGIDPFIRFAAENERFVWYTHPPVSGFHLFVPTERDLKRGFRSGTLNFSIDAEALTQPGWRHMVQTVWKQISAVVCPFYGHV